MNLQGRRLSTRVKPGDDVALLHTELRVLGYSLPRDEVRNKRFGKRTKEAVHDFQKRHRITPTGVVDEATAKRIDEETGKRRRESEAKEMPFTVRGQVTDANGAPRADLAVQAFDKDLPSLQRNQPLGEATTGTDGGYEIAYTAERFSRAEKDSADLVVRAVDGQGDTIAESAVLFNAPREVQVDLTLPDDGKGVPEFERLLAAVTPLIDTIAIVALNKEDVVFLAGETGFAEAYVDFLVIAFRHAARAENTIEPAAFYGLMREGLPAELDALLVQSPDALRRALGEAVRANIIAETFAGRVDEILDRLKALAIRLVLAEQGEGSFSGLLATAVPDPALHQAFLTVYAARKGTVEEFWTGLRNDPGLKNHADALQFSLGASIVAANHLPLVQALAEKRRAGDIAGLADLTRLDESEWRQLLTRSDGKPPIGAPAGVPGKDLAEQAANYARIVSDRLEDAFPMPFFRHRLEADDLPGKQDVLAFLAANPDFDLRTARIDAVLNNQPRAKAADAGGLGKQLKAMQRVYRVAPRYRQMSALLKGGIGSAQDMSRLGKQAFIGKYAAPFGGAALASRAHETALQVDATVLNTVAAFAPIGGRLGMHAMPDKAVRDLDDTPEWANLFGSAELCECAHCRSVYSPAAYFVDLLHFLRDRPAVAAGHSALDVLLDRRPDLADIELTCENTNTTLPYVDLVNEVLEEAVSPSAAFAPFVLDARFAADLDRRAPSPALLAAFGSALSANAVITPGGQAGAWTNSQSWWSIDDANWTYTVRRNIDGLRVAARGRQTRGTAEERAAAPQYINGAAYDEVLSAAVYPWSLPFELGAEEARVFLRPLDTSRHQLMETFLPGERAAILDHQAIARAHLGIGLKEAQIIDGREGNGDTPLEEPWRHWGFAAKIVSGHDWTVELAGRIDGFLARTSLSYVELLELLQSYFVNPVANGRRAIRIASPGGRDADTCATNLLSLEGLDKAAASRIMRFIRLQRRLSWTVRDLDRALLAFGPADPRQPNTALDDPGFIVRLSHVQRLTEATGLPLMSVLAWWAPATSAFWTAAYADSAETSPYAQLLRGRTAPVARGAGLPDDPATLSGTLRTASAAVTAALGITAGDLARLANDAELGFGGMDAPVTMETLTPLYRHAALARSARLAMPEYLIMLRLGAMNPFAGTADCLLFLEKLAALRAGGFTPAEADYLLWHRFGDADRIAPRPQDMAAALSDMRAELQKIAADNTFDAEPSAGTVDPVGELTRQKLAQLNWDAALIDKVVATIDQPGATVAAIALAKAFIGRAFNYFVHDFSAPLDSLPVGLRFPRAMVNRVYFDPAAVPSQLRFRGIMTDAERVTLLGLASEPAYVAAVRALHDKPNDPPSDPFLTRSDVDWMFRADASPADRFARVLERLLPYLRRTLGERLVVQKLAGAFTLDAAVMDAMLRRWVRSSAAGAAPAVEDFLRADFVDSSSNAPIAAPAFDVQFKSYLRLHKIALLANHLRLSSLQLGWLGEDGAIGAWPNLNALPAAEREPPASFDGLLQAIAIAALRDTLPGGEATLDGLFRLGRTDAASTADAHARVSELTGWNEEDLRFLTSIAVFDLTLPRALRSASTLSRLQACFALLNRTGMSARLCRDLCGDALTAALGEQVMHAARARRGEPDWLTAVRPLQDELRELRRKALTAYLIAHPAADQSWPDTNALYAHFLIDVEMASCMITSRVKQAIGSAQLFVQRCLLNLLPREVAANAEVDDRWNDWRWMKTYRVWEANRKIFLYPENWLEPELRDNKSPFFRALESELMQGDLTLERAEDAFVHYVAELDQVARLEVMGTYHQVEHDTYGHTTLDILHVFARTPADPRVYFYRQRLDAAEWTAWEKIEADVRDEHLIPVVWQRRLFLFWAVFTTRMGSVDQRMEGGNMTMATPPTFYDIQLAFSERRNGRWIAQKLTSMRLQTKEDDRWFEQPSQVSFCTRLGNDSSLTIFALTTRDATAPQQRAFRFDSPGSDASFVQRRAALMGLTGTQHQGMRLSNLPILLPPGPPSDWLPPLLLPAPEDAPALATATVPFSVHRQADESRLFQEPFFFVSPAFGSVQGNAARSGTTFLVTPKAVDRAAALAAMAVLNPDIADIPFASFSSSDESPTVVDPASRGLFVVAFPPAPDARRAVASRGSPGAEPSRPAMFLLTAIVFAPARQERLYRFHTFYHPYVRAFSHQLNRDGVRGLLQREVQLRPDLFLPRIPGGSAVPPLVFRDTYGPDAVDRPIVDDRYPSEDVDFEYEGAYALYNWELFVHAPLLIADRLSKNQRFEEAQQWLHYIFNPTDTSGFESPQRYWQTRRFFDTSREDYAHQQVASLLRLLANGADPRRAAALTADERRKLETAQTSVRLWRKNPFKPHVVARLRTVAYQKSVVMKYLDNLIAWGDQLFRRDTIESMNEATQLYVLAAEILGPRPEKVPPRNTAAPQTYRSLAARLDDFSNALIDLELLLPPVHHGGPVPPGGEARLTLPAILYFCIPQNDKLLGYWDKVADRLFKIRHCMNIEGTARQLPLFEPPIDPALLARAAAAGVDLRSVLNDSAAALPHYRFSVLAGRAGELVAEVKALGAALLAALEKGDAEGLALLRSRHEKEVLRSMRDLRLKQREEAQANRTALNASRDLAAHRYMHYQKLLGHNEVTVPGQNAILVEELTPAGAAIKDEAGVKQNLYERNEQGDLEWAHMFQQFASEHDMIAAFLHLVPQIKASPWGVGSSFGGSNLGHSLGAIGSGLRMAATHFAFSAGRSAKTGQLLMREGDWALQSNLAGKEIMQIDRQIAAADIRVEIARKELEHHDRQTSNADEVDTYLHEKYTNQDLYMWMAGQVADIYFQAYQLAYDMARRAERAMRFELGLTRSSFIQFGYWDSLKKGLLSGERLGHDLKRMEMAYIDGNRRDYEIAKSVSLVLHDPLALIRLKTSSECMVRLSEELFDADYPGHYLRRIKSVTLTIPAVVGPHTSINCTLTLQKSKFRTSVTGDYAEREPESDGDARFVYGVTPLQSIATSHAQNDSGLFELNFRDERYLPFEYAGAISEWRIELPKDTNAFDFDTISDVILKINYTARDGGEALRNAARANLASPGIPPERRRLFSLKHEFATEWSRLLQSTGLQEIQFETAPERFPFRTRGRNIAIRSFRVLLIPNGHPPASLDRFARVSIRRQADASGMPADPDRSGLFPGLREFEMNIGTPNSSPHRWVLRLYAPDSSARAPVELLHDIAVLCDYTVA